MARGAAIALLALIGLGSAPDAQVLRADVPPIPEQERFVRRNDLTATLRLTTPQVQIDESPRATLVLKNIAAKPLLIRKPMPDTDLFQNPYVSVYSESG